LREIFFILCVITYDDGEIYSEEMHITPASVTKMIDPIFFIVMGGILRFILIVMDLRAVGIASTQM